MLRRPRLGASAAEGGGIPASARNDGKRERRWRQRRIEAAAGFRQTEPARGRRVGLPEETR